MNAKRLEQIRRALREVTPGDWHTDAGWDGHPPPYSILTGRGDGGIGIPVLSHDGNAFENAHFLANSPKYVRELLAEVDRLRDIVCRAGG